MHKNSMASSGDSVNLFPFCFLELLIGFLFYLCLMGMIMHKISCYDDLLGVCCLPVPILFFADGS